MKKKIIVLLSIIILIITIIIVTLCFNNSKRNSSINMENIIQSEKEINNIDNNSNMLEDIKQNEISNQVDSNSNTNVDSKGSSLPNDSGLTVNGVPKTFNQDIMAKANIAYLLGCENISNNTNLEEYIEKNISKNGIFISEVSTYKKTGNPYEHIKERKEIMKDMLSSINLKYDINQDNYLISNGSDGEIEKNINKLILGDKKIIIGFVADYYTYINDYEKGIQLGGGFANSSYVSFKPYNNIYAFIFDENSTDSDDFYEMIKEISNLSS